MGRWLAQHGDQLATFISLASISLKGVDNLPAWATQLILIAGILATAAHQSFFPSANPTQPATPAKEYP